MLENNSKSVCTDCNAELESDYQNCPNCGALSPFLKEHLKRNKRSFITFLSVFLSILVITTVIILSNPNFWDRNPRDQVQMFFLFLSISGFVEIFVGIGAYKAGSKKNQITRSKGLQKEPSALLRRTGAIMMLISGVGIFYLLGFWLFLMSMMGM